MIRRAARRLYADPHFPVALALASFALVLFLAPLFL